MAHHQVELLTDDVDGPRSMGIVAAYRCRWLAERRARRENAVDARLDQSYLGTWTVREAD